MYTSLGCVNILSRWKREQILDSYKEITGDDKLLLDAACDYTVVIEVSE